MSSIVQLWRNLSSRRLIHLIGCHQPEKTKARRALVDFPCVGSVRSRVHKFYANRIHKPAISDIFPVMLHAGSLDLITPWLLETSYLKTSIEWSPKLLAGKTAAGIAICRFLFCLLTQAGNRGLLRRL